MISKPKSFKEATARLKELYRRQEASRGKEFHWHCITEYHQYKSWYDRHFSTQIDAARLAGRNSEI